MVLFVTPERVVATVMPFAKGLPRTEGQHRLAWWLAGRERADTPLWRLIGAPFGTTERLLSGELVPSDEMASAIVEATGGFVDWRDWQQPSAGTWDVEPLARPKAA